MNLYPATKKNYVGKDSYGNTRYAKIVDGKQVWVSVRNGIIQDGGINEKPFKKLYDKKGEFKNDERKIYYILDFIRLYIRKSF